ncbi:MAG: hypothetical protein AABW79_00490 [Nanoarchaeota archaeon]
MKRIEEPQVRSEYLHRDHPGVYRCLVKIGENVKGISRPRIIDTYPLEEVGAKYLHEILKKPCCASGVEESQLYNRLERIGIDKTFAKRMLDEIIKNNLFVFTEAGEGYKGIEGFNLSRIERKGKFYYHRKDKI